MAAGSKQTKNENDLNRHFYDTVELNFSTRVYEAMALETAENYYSLDDILATNEKIPSKIEMPIYRLGRFTESGLI